MSRDEGAVYEVAFSTPEGRETVTVWGTCAGDAGTRALPMIDARRGDREAKVDSVTFAWTRYKRDI